MYCKECKFYEPNQIEKWTNVEEWKKDRNVPRVFEIIGNNKFGVCKEVVVDAKDWGDKQMNEVYAKIMTWDGSSYMSGAYISEDFGCIKFKSASSYFENED